MQTVLVPQQQQQQQQQQKFPAKMQTVFGTTLKFATRDIVVSTSKPKFPVDHGWPSAKRAWTLKMQ